MNENENLIKNFETKARHEHAISEDIYKKAKQYTELNYLELKGVFLDQNVKHMRREKNQLNSFWGWKKDCHKWDN